MTKQLFVIYIVTLKYTFSKAKKTRNACEFRIIIFFTKMIPNLNYHFINFIKK